MLFQNKMQKQLHENKLWDGEHLIFCTKWNASIGAKFITTYENFLYITPITGGVWGVNVKKTKKIDKQEISDIKYDKGNFFKAKKIIIPLKNGKTLKYALITNVDVDGAIDLIDNWFQKK